MDHNTLITGGTGFIGHWMNKEHECWQLDKLGWGEGKCFPNHWKYIIHLAPVPVDDVIKSAKNSGATVLLASSGGVYDPEPTDYCKMKMDDENKLLASGLDVRIARIFTTCGAHMKWDRYAIGKFIKAAIQRQPMMINAGITRSYMYGSDLAEWLWAILLHGKPGSIYNVGSEGAVSLDRLGREISKHITNTIISISKPVHQYDPHPYYVPDTIATRMELGLSIKVPFEEAVAKTVEDYRNEQT
jgi:nucleoside-diphosphate-sugar epimerase